MNGKPRYRIIALDVDGTLLNDAHELSEGNKDAVVRAAASGAQVVLCTGRGASNAFYLLEELGLSGMLVTHNGATTVRSDTQQLVSGFAYTMRDLEPVVAYCRRVGLHFDVNSVLELYADRVDVEAQAMYDRFGIQPTVVEDLTLLQAAVYKVSVFGPEERMDQLEADWKGLGCRLSYVRSDARFVDMMHPDASKGNALRELARLEGIPREEILAIGNYYNDIDMIRFAGLGVAMGNSPDAVKAAADLVTVSNNEDGVRRVLLEHVLE